MAVGYGLVGRQKKIARESLKIAFGDSKTDEEIAQIVRQCFHNLGRGMVEMLYYLSHPNKVEQFVHFEGQEHLDNALKQGKGVVAITAHFGNFPLMMLYCALKGYPSNSIIRPTRDQKLEKYLFRKRKESGLNTVYAVPRKECVSQSLKVLRNNEVLFIPMDQNFGSAGGVFVDFFGQKAATATGPVVFAKRTGALIVPMFIVRDGDSNRHKVIIEKPITLVEKETEDQTLSYNIGVITHLIEQYIRQYPHEWGWMHRRWKSKPSSPDAKRTGV